MSNYADGAFDTKYGKIHMSNPGPKADPPYGNVQTYIQTATRHVVLQGPAMKAFKAAEARCATRRHKHILITGVGYRSWAAQEKLYEQEPGRFANPDGSMHVEALAIDVDQTQGTLRLAKIKTALEAEGWHYAVEGEPWHASFHLKG